ncbi:NAD(P)-binding domain-containing protein [Nocardioides psychrotolerans]|uniref:NAD(P)-binding domain-containing protein n=1 Tax=Nocardioides psychrotolerans TaxID=1005945 RepID=UPI0031377645
MDLDVVIVGGGQSGLATAWHLVRLNRRREVPLTFEVLDDRSRAGGAWQDGWPSLELFSPAAYSSLPGWPMPPWRGPGNPSAAHVRDYLTAYEQRYDLPVRRPVAVTGVSGIGDPSGPLVVHASDGDRQAGVVVNATGSWRRPFWPTVPGMRDFAGTQRHTADYTGPTAYDGLRVLVVGGGNSGAQIAADLLPVARELTWATQRTPRYLPDDVDGRALFEAATAAVAGQGGGVGSLGDIVAVPSVRHARDELGLHAAPMPDRLTASGVRWADGTERAFDAVIWCTGFRPALGHLRGVARPNGGVVSPDDERVLFVGYGDWCGPASATLIGVGRSAKDAAARAAAVLDG